MQEEQRAQLRALIEEGTGRDLAAVPGDLKTDIKRGCAQDLALAVQLLGEGLRSKHAQTRLLTLELVDAVFVRSRKFRTLFLEHLPEVLRLLLGVSLDTAQSRTTVATAASARPKPPAIDEYLHEASLEALERWEAAFGADHRVLRTSITFLRKTLKLPFPGTVGKLKQRREQDVQQAHTYTRKFDTHFNPSL
jgi:hypothetical protein